MITIKKTIETNKLVIEYDSDSTNPREWNNLGYFITIDKNYRSPDNNKEFINIVKETGDEANSQEEHIEMIKNRIDSETNEKVLKIYPIVKYEHGGVVYKLGTEHGFDCSNNGFYIITEKTFNERGVFQENWKTVINGELETYNKYINGEVYSFILYNNNGDIEDGCGGFYDVEEIRECLPEEFKNEDLHEYLKY